MYVAICRKRILAEVFVCFPFLNILYDLNKLRNILQNLSEFSTNVFSPSLVGGRLFCCLCVRAILHVQPAYYKKICFKHFFYLKISCALQVISYHPKYGWYCKFFLQFVTHRNNYIRPNIFLISVKFQEVFIVRLSLSYLSLCQRTRGYLG